jgi:hypothetical protein
MTDRYYPDLGSEPVVPQMQNRHAIAVRRLNSLWRSAKSSAPVTRLATSSGMVPSTSTRLSAAAQRP